MALNDDSETNLKCPFLIGFGSGGLCCTNLMEDSPHESCVIAERYEQFGPSEVQDQELVEL